MTDAVDDDFEIVEAPADSTERLRRYRIIAPDGRQELVTRAELDALHERRREGEARRARAARRRRTLALGLATVPLFVVVAIVARALLAPGAQSGDERIEAAPVAVAPAGAAPVAAPSVPAAPAEAEPAKAEPAKAAPAKASSAGAVRRDAPPPRSPARPVTSPQPLTSPQRLISPQRSTVRPGASAAERLERDAEAAVAAWAEAWRSRDVDAYLRSYAPGFSRWGLPPEAWQRSRRNRITSVPWIEVELAGVRVDVVAPERARIAFVQRYRDPGYADEVFKVLLAERQGGELLIVAEADRPLQAP